LYLRDVHSQVRILAKCFATASPQLLVTGSRSLRMLYYVSHARHISTMKRGRQHDLFRCNDWEFGSKSAKQLVGRGAEDVEVGIAG
jgi:hypothetical protein